MYFELSEGQKHYITHASSLIEHLKQDDTVIADKGYDSDAFREFIANKGGKSVIPKRRYKSTYMDTSNRSTTF